MVSHLSCVSETSHSCSFLSSQEGLELSPTGQRDFGEVRTGGTRESQSRRGQVISAFLGGQEVGESGVENF